MNSQYLCIPCYKYESDEVERNLSCKCTVLCYILEYIHIVQIAKRRIRPVLAFNMHIPDQVECLVVFACWKQAPDLCVSFLFVKYLYIFQYTVDGLNFVVYQFSWFCGGSNPRIPKPTKWSLFIWIMKENTGHEFWTPRMYHFCSIHENWFSRK